MFLTWIQNIIINYSKLNQIDKDTQKKIQNLQPNYFASPSLS